MKYLTQYIKRHSLIIGLVLMFLYTWTIDLSNSGVLPFRFPFAVVLTVGWGFIFVSLFMTWYTLGTDAMKTLFRRFFIWRVSWKWYLIAILLLPGLQFVSALLTLSLTDVPVDFSEAMIHDVVPLSAPWFVLVIPWMVFEILTNGEEMGWRGYVLPRLQSRYNALTSSLILGVIWSFWHFPKFFGTGMNSGLSIPWFTIFTMASAILYTWLYNNSQGSLLLLVLFHATNNTAGMFLPVPFASPGGIDQNMLVVTYLTAAIFVTYIAGPANLSRTELRQIQKTQNEELNLMAEIKKAGQTL